MAALDDQLAALRTQAQAAVARGDIATANQLGAQAAQLRSAAPAANAAPVSPAAPPAAAPAPAATVTPPAAAPVQAAPVRSSGIPSILQPRDDAERQLFAQAVAQRARGQTAAYNHTIRQIAIRRVGAQGGPDGSPQQYQAQGTTFGLNLVAPVADYLGAALDTFGDHAHGESTDFGQNLSDREQVRQRLSATHPVSAGAGVTAGLLASAPIAEAAVPAAVARAGTVGRLALTAGAQGAALGAGSGAEHAQEQHQNVLDAAGTIATEAGTQAAENAAGAWLLGHVGRAAFGGLRAAIGVFQPTQRGFAALAATDAARNLGLTPANLLTAANQFRAAAGRAPSPMEILQAAGEQAQNPLAARTVGQLVGRSPRANAVVAMAAQNSEPSTTQTSNALFQHLDNVAIDANNDPALSNFFARPNVQRVIRMIRSSDPEMGQRLDAASDGTAPLAGRDADFLRRTLMKGGTGPSGIRFGSVQLGNDISGILDNATNGQYSAALAAHGANKATLETAEQSVQRVARPAAPAPANEASSAAETIGHTAAAAVVGHGPAVAFRAARLITKGIAGISNRQAEGLAQYLAAQGPNAVDDFATRLQNARGTAATVGIVRDALARSALGLAAGASESSNLPADQAPAPAAAPEEVTPTSLPTPAPGVRFTAQDIPQSYMDSMTQRESGGRADARAPVGTATGAHQFIQSTWLQTIKQHADELGMQNVAAHISTSGSVDDPAMRERILALRNNPEISALVARAYTAENANFLADRLGRAPKPGELYAAHVLGPAGAYHLISAAAQSLPNAAAIFPREAAANHNLFYQGRTPLSAAAVLAKLNV